MKQDKGEVSSSFTPSPDLVMAYILEYSNYKEDTFCFFESSVSEM